MAPEPISEPRGRLHSPTVQVSLVGVIFFFVFLAYSTVQAFATKLYGPDLGSNMETILYSAFTIACFFGPPVTNRLGCRFTMFIGILGYASLIAASLAFTGNKDSNVLGALVCVGGALNGVGAALLWTAQGRFMMEYSDGTDGGRLFGIFWAFLNASSVAGGFLTFFYFGGNDADASAGLFVIFLAVVLVGSLVVFLLTEPPPRAVNASVFTMDSDPESSFWVAEMMCTLRLFRSRRMQILTLVFLYSGVNQPYQLDTFTARFFADKAQGLEMVVFYSFEIFGALFAGYSLDSCNPEHRQRRAVQQLSFFLVITLLGNAVAAWYEVRRQRTGEPEHMEFNQDVSVAATVASALWGTSDAMIQSYAYWLITISYSSGAELARATGFFKMVQSFGWTVGFLLVPEERLKPIGQLIMITVVCVAGTALALLELPKAGGCGVAVLDSEKALTDGFGPEPQTQKG